MRNIPQQAETVDLAQELEHFQSWGSHNVMAEMASFAFPLASVLIGILFFLLNPIWIVSSFVFGIQGTERLKKGNVDGARRSLAYGRLVNWLMILVGIVAWTLFFKYGEPAKLRAEHRAREPQVEMVHPASPESEAFRPAATSPSIRTEIRAAMTGGHVLQVWNTTSETITCTATLENPELSKSPTYEFMLAPDAKKPQELGVMQFGHRIKKKPKCTVIIQVHETGEVYRYTP